MRSRSGSTAGRHLARRRHSGHALRPLSPRDRPYRERGWSDRQDSRSARDGGLLPVAFHGRRSRVLPLRSLRLNRVASVRVVVRKNAYIDSVTLLQVSAEVASVPGVQEAALVMGTDLNRDVLRDSDLLVGDAQTASPNDLILAVRAEDDASLERALAEAERLLSNRRISIPMRGVDAAASRSIRSAHRQSPEATLAVISVPGPYAAGEARQALAEGLHVFLFSDNVSLHDEIDLKRRGRDQGLLVMGPDCGTAILNGVGLGFANVVRRGRIGLVGASGTGMQEITSLLHQAGEGISHAIGTGGRDMYAEVGGITTMQALDLLRDDPLTHTIVLVAKPSAPEVAERVLHQAAQTGKPVVACLLGTDLQPP